MSTPFNNYFGDARLRPPLDGGKVSVEGPLVLEVAQDATRKPSLEILLNPVNSSVMRIPPANFFDYGEVVIKGITGGRDGRVVAIINNSGGALEFRDEEETVAAEHRFALPNGDWNVPTGTWTWALYDGESRRWRLEIPGRGLTSSTRFLCEDGTWKHLTYSFNGDTFATHIVLTDFSLTSTLATGAPGNLMQRTYTDKWNGTNKIAAYFNCY